MPSVTDVEQAEGEGASLFPDFINLLHDEEGYRERVYKDSEGYLTAGLGHKLTGNDLKLYKLNDRVPDEILQEWEKKDTEKAWEAALSQLIELGIDAESSPEFTIVLGSVNFQLGTSWYKDHKKTWSFLKAGNYKEAAEEAARSRWYRQTPDRVVTFQRAIRGL